MKSYTRSPKVSTFHLYELICMTEQYFKAGRIAKMKYLIVVEKTDTGFSAYSPDAPGCIATGATREEVERLMGEALEFHFDGCASKAGNRRRPNPTAFMWSFPAESGLRKQEPSLYGPSGCQYACFMGDPARLARVHKARERQMARV
jgi:predicted RNase H-like HicB family nuclease